VDEIVAAGGQALGFECDVTDPAAQADVAKQVFDRWGSVDILVANAGGGSGTPATTTASTLDPEQLRIVVERNLYGTIFSCVAVAPYMKEQRQGKIITTSSIAGIQAITGGGYAHYGAAKAGIAMYTRYLAHDLGQYGITCNCIAPGVVATGRIVAVGVGDPNKTSSPNAAGRAGTVDELADVVAFLASDASSYLNGAVIPVDGGSSRGAA
jgi:3-oxoacyl-[acyl-carrier protein] reductase